MGKREILFRGKRVDNGEWVEGGFFENSEEEGLVTYIFAHIGGAIPAFPESVGQFSGFYGKNGVKIFDGDIIKYVVRKRTKDHTYITKVIHKNGFVPLENQSIFMNMAFLSLVVLQIEVIGNIYENPELLK